MTYAEKLKDPRWQKKRLEIMKRDKFQCKLCKDEETELQVHHKEYISGNDPWDYTNNLLITICKHCHDEISDNQFKDIPLNEISVYKSNDWRGGSRIMFITHDNVCCMRIYSDDGTFLVGFNLSNDIPDIIRILNKARRNGL
jgi:hypothetical protein